MRNHRQFVIVMRTSVVQNREREKYKKVPKEAIDYLHADIKKTVPDAQMHFLRYRKGGGAFASHGRGESGSKDEDRLGIIYGESFRI